MDGQISITDYMASRTFDRNGREYEARHGIGLTGARTVSIGIGSRWTISRLMDGA